MRYFLNEKSNICVVTTNEKSSSYLEEGYIEITKIQYSKLHGCLHVEDK